MFGNTYTTIRPSLRLPRYEVLDTGTSGGVTHAFKTNWVMELPFGQGRRWLANSNGFVDRLVGGWELNGVAALQSGRLLDYGNVRLVGMSKEDCRTPSASTPTR